MKRKILLTFIILIAGVSATMAQAYIVNPIPSFNFPMIEPQAIFHENKMIVNNNKEKRDMDVVVSTRSTSWVPVFAIVWVFKKNHNVIKGPYIVFPGVKLEVPIDKSKWGVLVQCDASIDVSVWIDD